MLVFFGVPLLLRGGGVGVVADEELVGGGVWGTLVSTINACCFDCFKEVVVGVVERVGSVTSALGVCGVSLGDFLAVAFFSAPTGFAAAGDESDLDCGFSGAG